MADRLPLRDLADINPESLGAGTPSSFEFRYVDLASVSHGRIDWEATSVQQFGSAPSRARRLLRDGDVLFGTVRPALRSHAALRSGPSVCVASTGFAVVRAREGVSEPGFLAHFLLSDICARQARRVEVGSNYPAVSESDVGRFGVPPFALGEQRRIAEILDALDDTIAATERLIDKVESLVRGILARLLGATSWRDAERLCRLSDVLAERPRNGHSPIEAAEWQGAYLLGLGCLTTGGFEPRQLKNAPVGDPRLRRALLADGDLLISRSNTREAVGLVGRFRALDAPAYYPDLMMRLRPKAEIRSDYLELVLRSQPARRYIQSRAAGTSGSMVKIGAGTLLAMSIPVLDIERQSQLVAQVEAATRRSDCERANLLKLRSVRAGLADDLFTGRVRTVPA